jgi:hypothetical protein
MEYEADWSCADNDVNEAVQAFLGLRSALAVAKREAKQARRDAEEAVALRDACRAKMAAGQWADIVDDDDDDDAFSAVEPSASSMAVYVARSTTSGAAGRRSRAKQKEAAASLLPAASVWQAAQQKGQSRSLAPDYSPSIFQGKEEGWPALASGRTLRRRKQREPKPP